MNLAGSTVEQDGIVVVLAIVGADHQCTYKYQCDHRPWDAPPGNIVDNRPEGQRAAPEPRNGQQALHRTELVDEADAIPVHGDDAVAAAGMMTDWAVVSGEQKWGCPFGGLRLSALAFINDPQFIIIGDITRSRPRPAGARAPGDSDLRSSASGARAATPVYVFLSSKKVFLTTNRAKCVL